MSELDLLLHRTIQDGKKYDALIPASTCERSYLGKGMTDFTVDAMADWIIECFSDMQKVAPLLSNSSLQRTCNSVHDFCFTHFQYKADLEDQFLLSPACAWSSRYEGLDCKSYSIVASSILVNLNIGHYIRRVRQPGFKPNQWSHVYIIVPADQKTFDLAKGYYVIDGTVAEPGEAYFLEKSDVFMSGMKHYGLRGAAPQGLNGVNYDQIKGLFSTGGIFSKLSCIGGSTTSADFDAAFSLIVPWFTDAFNQVNLAVGSNSPTVLALVQKLFTNAAQIADHSLCTSQHKWQSSCTQSALNAYRDLGAYFFKVTDTGFKAWLENYFTVTYESVTMPNNTFETPIRNSAGKGPDKNQYVRNVTFNRPQTIVLKPTTTTVMRFELTPYVANVASYTNFNPITALQGMGTILASFGVGNSNGTTITTTTTNGQSGTTTDTGITPIVPDNNTKVDSAGLGAVGWVLLAIGGSMAVRAAMGLEPVPGMGGKPSKTSTASKPAARKKATTKKATK